jgi:hypothetical protein
MGRGIAWGLEVKENVRQAAKIRSGVGHGERLGKMNDIVSLNRLQAHGKWEMSGLRLYNWR